MPVPWAQTSCMSSSCSKSCPTQLWTFPMIGCLQKLWMSHLTTLIMKKFFLISDLNLPSFGLKPLHSPFQYKEKKRLLKTHSIYWKATIRPMQSLLFSRLNKPSCLHRRGASALYHFHGPPLDFSCWGPRTGYNCSKVPLHLLWHKWIGRADVWESSSPPSATPPHTEVSYCFTSFHFFLIRYISLGTKLHINIT